MPTKPYVNARTGEVQQIPDGVHPAFHYPPGGRRASLSRHLVERLEAAPHAIAKACVADLVSGQTFAEWYRKPAGAFPLAYLSPEVAARLGAKTQLVGLSEETLAKQLREHPEITLDEYPKVQAAIDRGLEVPGNQPNTSVYLLDEADGYPSATITEYGARRYGRAHMGEAYGNEAWEDAWQLNLPETLVIPRRHGRSAHGERYRVWGDAELECVMQKRKPGGSILFFRYGGI